MRIEAAGFSDSIWWSGPDSSTLGQNHMAGFCEDDSEPSRVAERLAVPEEGIYFY